ncbi:MAG: hypothetical protein EHM91_16140 [Planctomycetota bacterium]|nr:MAG: hypothetical protein EHM91_16140 [Planctomycetota bacterium]
MKPEDLFGLVVMVVTMLLVLGSMVRTSRRLSRARPESTERPSQPRRIVLPPPAARVPAPRVVPPKRAVPSQRRPVSSLEARVLRNRRLSAGARLILASEILSPPKALRRRR